MNSLSNELKEMKLDTPTYHRYESRSFDGSFKIIWHYGYCNTEINNISYAYGPAMTEFDKDGNLICERWYFNNLPENITGKADVIFYNLDGTIKYKKFNSPNHTYYLWQAEYVYVAKDTHFIKITNNKGVEVKCTDHSYWNLLYCL